MYQSYEVHEGFYDEGQGIPKMYGLTRHDELCDKIQLDHKLSETEINLVSVGIWKGIESERLLKNEVIDGLLKKIEGLEAIARFYVGDFDGKEGSKWHGDNFFFEDKFGMTYPDRGRMASQYLQRNTVTLEAGEIIKRGKAVYLGEDGKAYNAVKEDTTLEER